MLTRAALASLSLGLAAPLLLAPPASASHGGGDDVVRRGSCSGSADWKLKAKPDDGRFEVELEIDSNHSGQVWRWRITHDGSVSARGWSTTRPPSGSFEVHRRLSDLSGYDHLGFRASHRLGRGGTGQVCRGTIVL